MRNKSLTTRQLQSTPELLDCVTLLNVPLVVRHGSISGKTLHYEAGKSACLAYSKSHSVNPKRLPKLFIESLMRQEKYVF